MVKSSNVMVLVALILLAGCGKKGMPTWVDPQQEEGKSTPAPEKTLYPPA